MMLNKFETEISPKKMGEYYRQEISQKKMGEYYTQEKGRRGLYSEYFFRRMSPGSSVLISSVFSDRSFRSGEVRGQD